MNAYEKAYRQLIGRGFCHLSSYELNGYIYKSRWRARLAVAFLAAAVLAYIM